MTLAAAMAACIIASGLLVMLWLWLGPETREPRAIRRVLSSGNG
jgi:hypothetical protein